MSAERAGTADRDEIIAFCDDLLDANGFEDYGPNGLQVPGRREVAKVATGVTANRQFLERAVQSGAELAIAHHGLFFGDAPSGLSEPMAERLRIALVAGLSVAAYHLPLDAHAEIGNNALLCEALGLRASGEVIGMVKGRPIGVIGRADPGIPIEELVARVRGALRREPLVFPAGPASVRTVGIVSGAGARALAEAVSLRLDAFVTGEPAEHAMGDAEEGCVHFLAAGHYATETFGSRRLGELVAREFGVAHEFIDIPNPV